jgi:hypothetical protein
VEGVVRDSVFERGEEERKISAMKVQRQCLFMLVKIG